MYETLTQPYVKDIYEMDVTELASHGHEIYKSNDKNYWRLGEIASLVETRYGEDTLGQWVMEVGCSKSRAKAYRQAFQMFGGEMHEDYPNLFFSHFEVAMSAQKVMNPVDFLDMCSDQGLTIDQSRRELRIIKGGTALTKVAEFTAESVQIKGDGSICIMPVDGFDTKLLITSKTMTFRVYVESDKETA